ncbi:hypothetical protein NL676_036082 [Syzygium grande]|nr:hypothetical protein NL676_036082 [Syzygium grande]
MGIENDRDENRVPGANRYFYSGADAERSSDSLQSIAGGGTSYWTCGSQGMKEREERTNSATPPAPAVCPFAPIYKEKEILDALEPIAGQSYRHPDDREITFPVHVSVTKQRRQKKIPRSTETFDHKGNEACGLVVSSSTQNIYFLPVQAQGRVLAISQALNALFTDIESTQDCLFEFS